MTRKLVVIGVALMIIVGLGYLSWPMDGPFQAFCDSVQQRSGWRVSAEGARWVPWGDITLSGMRVESPKGGRVHMTHVTISPQAAALFQASLLFLVRIEGLQVDPGSWGIRNATMQDSISADVVAKTGTAAVHIDTQKTTLRSLDVQGPLIKLQGEGWMSKAQQAHLDMNGALKRKALVRMRLVEPDEMKEESWEPFRLKLDGAMSKPAISFNSSFFTISLSQKNLHGE